MKTRTSTLAVILLAAVALASGAYALGSQTGGGGALASGSNASAPTGSSGAGATNVAAQGPRTVRGLRRGARDFGLDALARKLGVTSTQLRDALQAIRQAKTPQQRRTEAIQALAAALGKPVDQVTSAVSSVLPGLGQGRGPGRRFAGDFAAALAKALGVDQSKVQAGLDKARQDLQAQRGPGNGPRDHRDRGAFGATIVNDVASATGIDAAKVRSALQDLRPQRGDRRDRRAARDDIRQKLATALGVTTAQLDAAFKTVATQARDQFAADLAQRLGIDVQKVKDALASLPGPGRRHP